MAIVQREWTVQPLYILFALKRHVQTILARLVDPHAKILDAKDFAVFFAVERLKIQAIRVKEVAQITPIVNLLGGRVERANAESAQALALTIGAIACVLVRTVRFAQKVANVVAGQYVQVRIGERVAVDNAFLALQKPRRLLFELANVR